MPPWEVPKTSSCTKAYSDPNLERIRTSTQALEFYTNTRTGLIQCFINNPYVYVTPPGKRRAMPASKETRMNILADSMDCSVLLLHKVAVVHHLITSSTRLSHKMFKAKAALTSVLLHLPSTVFSKPPPPSSSPPCPAGGPIYPFPHNLSSHAF